jgi:DNA-binding IscR family transcriptional regulator
MKTRTYAIRMIQFMVKKAEGTRFKARELAKALNIPPQYASKVCQSLARFGILRGGRGRTGGYRLVDAHISLLTFCGGVTCPIGMEVCVFRKKCPLHSECIRISDKMSLSELGAFTKTISTARTEESDAEKLQRVHRFHGVATALWR